MYKIYAEVLEDKALEQFRSALKCDYVVKAALMADAHAGYALPIGGVVATKDMVVPAWVGYDIGCGMCGMKLKMEAGEFDHKELFDKIYATIPVGRAQHTTKQNVPTPTSTLIREGLNKKGYFQLGTLGGGNHFLEIGEGRDGYIWIIVHSGSRNLGHLVAEHYMQKAYEASLDRTEFENEFEAKNQAFKKANPEKYEISKTRYAENKIKKKKGKADVESHYPLHVDSELGKNYISDMNYCLDYAIANRKNMIEKVRELLGYPDELQFINRNHNHAELKDGLWIHRKGATHAEKGMMGVIPGNMRDGCFIVEGKGNKDSLCSSSHGAGRVLSRMAAMEKLDLADFQKKMSDACIIAKVDIETLDESPDAYKNIFDVIAAQGDLIDVIDHVTPLINIKG